MYLRSVIVGDRQTGVNEKTITVSAQTIVGCNGGLGKVVYERLPDQQLQGFDDDVVRLCSGNTSFSKLLFGSSVSASQICNLLWYKESKKYF